MSTDHRTHSNIMRDREMQQHLDIYRTRVQGQQLSALELQEMAADLQATLRDGVHSTTKVERIENELKVLGELTDEARGPEPTPEEHVQYLRDCGQFAAAERLEFGIRLANAQGAVAEIQARLTANEYTNDAERELDKAELREAQRALEKIGADPHFDREDRSQALEAESINLRSIATQLLENSDPSVKSQGEATMKEADAKLQEATALRDHDGNARQAYLESIGNQAA